VSPAAGWVVFVVGMLMAAAGFYWMYNLMGGQ
jgi:Flp pilus assembly protein TadB